MANRSDIVCDASGLINFLAVERIAEMVRAIPHRLVATETVAGEVRFGDDERKLELLIEQRLIEIIPLNDVGSATMVDLAGREPPDDLDDGEASTIALAVQLGCAALIDERKGIRVGTGLLGVERIVTTVDLFKMPEVGSALGVRGVGDALFEALSRARMRVQARHVEWVRAQVGAERAAACTSLKRIKK